MKATFGLITLVAFLSVATMALLVSRPAVPATVQQQDPTEDVDKPTSDATEAFYRNQTPEPVFTLTPVDPTRGKYIGWASTDIAQVVMEGLTARGLAQQPMTLLEARDVWSTSAQQVVDPEAVAHNGDPDLAIVLSGTFLPTSTLRSPPHQYAFALVLVDRISGTVYAYRLSDDPSRLQSMLPPP